MCEREIERESVRGGTERESTYYDDLEGQARLFEVLNEQPHDDADVVVLLVGRQQH